MLRESLSCDKLIAASSATALQSATSDKLYFCCYCPRIDLLSVTHVIVCMALEVPILFFLFVLLLLQNTSIAAAAESLSRDKLIAASGAAATSMQSATSDKLYRCCCCPRIDLLSVTHVIVCMALEVSFFFRARFSV